MTNPIHWFHEHHIHRRRIRVLADRICELVPPDASLLDVGCGDGQLAALVQKRRPDVNIRGLDVLVRDDTAIEVDPFDGINIPYEDDQFDVVMLVDVLHHADSASDLLRQCARAAKSHILIKDHYLQGFAAQRTLMWMDHVGNARHGVEIPCNYLTPDQWSELFDANSLRVDRCIDHLGLYPPPLSWFFERRLHFLAILDVHSS